MFNACVVFFALGVKTNWFITVWTLGYCLITLPVIRWLSRPILPATYTWRTKEGDLRFAHARQREYCEAVAFYGGQEEEKCVGLSVILAHGSHAHVRMHNLRPL
jgi:ABC-type uncharacterized transport system fused permease/ATPase subunit